jgi:hypothetical protein
MCGREGGGWDVVMWWGTSKHSLKRFYFYGSVGLNTIYNYMCCLNPTIEYF